MIRYYSATQKRTAWTRARDSAFVAAFFLCVPATWIANATVSRPVTAFSLNGWIAESAAASAAAGGGSPRIDAVLSTNARAGKGSLPGMKIAGNFTLAISDHYRGWPLTTSVQRQPARLDLDLFAQPTPQVNVHLEGDSPMRLAIERSLEDDEQHEVLGHWRHGGSSTRMHWINWVIAAGVWWILMVFAASFVINAAQFVSLLGRRQTIKRQSAWRSQGRCAACGYDLTGLEFNERCPECGALVM